MSAKTLKTIDLELCRKRPLNDFSEQSGKATRGKLLVVGGSARLPGAILLCARTALRTGCGTVRVATPKSVALAIGVACPELMVLPLPETKSGTIARSALQVLAEQYEACDAAVIGPGLDENPGNRAIRARICRPMSVADSTRCQCNVRCKYLHQLSRVAHLDAARWRNANLNRTRI